MSRREDIDNSIWADPDFLDLSPDAKLLYVWSFTNAHCNMAGLYKVAERTMRAETGLPQGRLAKAITELCSRDFWRTHDAWVWVRSRVKYLRSRNPNMAKAVAKDIDMLPIGHVLRSEWLATYGDAPWLYEAVSGNRSATVPEPFRNVQGQGQGQGLRQGQGSRDVA